MKTITKLSILVLSIGVFMFGCQNLTDLTSPDSTAQFKKSQVVNMSMPSVDALLSAELFLYIDTDGGFGAGELNNQTVNIHRVTSNWDEMLVTWDNFGGYSSNVINHFQVDAAGWKSVDITALVEAWLNGTENDGLLLDQVNEAYPRGLYHSNENSSGSGPYLKLTIETDSETREIILHATADTYIWELNPNTNYGYKPYLFTGWKDGTDKEKQTLIKFDLDAGCTLTPGYWKTHADPDKKKYDDTWEQLTNAADTDFYSSGQSYLEVLWTPRHGNEYYILAFQYIAAQLNLLAGASDASISEEMAQAEDYFNYYTPDNPSDESFTRSEVISIAETLDQYNNGDLWPLHCDH